MKILSVTLENVKSYQKEVIHFNDGINVIAGRNGAGKSTLIEAIGLALFGYMNKDYSYQDFISHGATSGGITVEFEADNCRYSIARTFNNRGTKGWAIYDFQTDETVETHTVEDVNYTLAQILGMAESISLAELFERIIGVSQGTFTEPFLRSTGGRKEYFERIFMLDNYKIAYSKSSEPAGLLRDKCDALEKELIMLRTRVENYAQLQSEKAEEELRLIAQRENLKAEQELLQNVRAEVQKLKAVKEEIQEWESKILRLKSQQEQLAERLIAVKADSKVSLEAKELVERYQATHTAYLTLKETISELEQKLEQQDELTAEKATLEKEMAVKSEKLKSDRENLASTREILLREAGQRMEEVDEYTIPLEGIERELKTVGEELMKIDKASGDLDRIANNCQQCKHSYQQIEERLTEITNLKLEINALDEKLAELPILEQEVAKVPQCETALENANREISALETRIAAEKENMERVGDGLCPFLQTDCRNLEGQSLKEYFSGRMVVLERDKDAKVAEKSVLALEMQFLREQAKKLTTLQVLREERQDRVEKLNHARERGQEAVQAIYERLRTVYHDLAALKKVGYLAESGELAFQELLPLELAQEQRRLCIELDIAENYLNLGRQELTALERLNLEKKEDLTRRRAEYMGKISQIQEQRKDISRKLAELARTEEVLTAEEETLAANQTKLGELAAALEAFGDLKGELKLHREKLITLEEGNQIYLTNWQKAGELPQLQEQEERFQATLTTLAGEITTVREQLLQAEEQFTTENLQQLEVKSDQLNREVSQSETLIKESERRIKEFSDRLKEMDQVKNQIAAREEKEARLQKALSLMNFIRNVFNTSAEEIAGVFLQYISHEATNIYRQLSGENVQLIWEKDYQIKLKDKHRMRVFKQLSGGEQMSAAFAIRLALLRKFSSVRLGFFDEPTTHLDEFHRLNIAQAIAGIREKGDDYFEQIFVISHDDTFTTLTENLVRIEKDEERGSYLVRES